MIFIALKDNKILFTCESDSQQGIIDSLKYEGIIEYDEIKHIPNDYFQGRNQEDIRQFNPITFERKTEEEVFEELGITILNQFERIIFNDGYKIITSYKDEIIYNKEDYIKSKKCETDEIEAGYTLKKPIDNFPCKWDVDKWIIDIEKVKENKLKEINMNFEQEIFDGKFKSSSIGIEVDCRKSPVKNDLQTLQSLISNMERNGLSKITYKGYTESIDTNLTNLKKLQFEMEDYGITLIQKKWLLQNKINKTTSIEEIQNISW